jgi:hypothetical protein
MSIAYRLNRLVAGFLAALSLFVFPISVFGENVVGLLYGNWARSQIECRVPELSFLADSAIIRLDADGAPTEFAYPGIEYKNIEEGIVVNLGRRHPFGKAASKTSLIFVEVSHKRMAMKLKGARHIDFVRCL